MKAKIKLAQSFLRVLIFASLCCLLITAVTVQASQLQPGEVKSGHQSSAYASDTVLIKFTATASFSQQGYARSLMNGQRIRSYGLVNGLEHMQLGQGLGVERAIEILQQLPFVDYVEPDYLHFADTSDTYYGLQCGLENTGQDIR